MAAGQPLWWALVVLASCGPQFEDGHLLDELRILALRADPPEVGVGDEVRLEALVVSPSGQEVTTRMWQCAARLGMRQGCQRFDDSLYLGEGISARIEIDPSFDEWLELTQGMPVYQLITIVAQSASDEERAIKRIVVSRQEAAPNENPEMEALLLDEEEQESTVAPRVDRGARIAVRPVIARGSAESYERLSIRGENVPSVETLYMSYYYTCGHIAALRSGEMDELGATFTAPSEPGHCSLHAILRDGRGGEDFRTRQIRVD